MPCAFWPASDPRALLLAALAIPSLAAGLPMDAWNALIPVARQSGLLARLCLRLNEAGVLDQVPERPRAHLAAASTLAEKHGRDVLAEIGHVARALAPVAGPALLLKGAAYVAAGLPAAKGRLFSDVDVLVPAALLPRAENALMLAGWAPEAADTYDQSYYRRWMHQVPPLRHMARGTVADLHHAIAPPTARHAVPAAPILARARPVLDGLALVPGPEDLVLHSAAHLFNEGEFAHGLRDLSDMDLLVRHFAAMPGFWPRLTERARELGLASPAFHALRLAAQLFATPVPADTAAALAAPLPPVRRLALGLLFEHALQPPHDSCRGPLGRMAAGILYLRGHWLRMPPGLLAPHLARKGLKHLRHALLGRGAA